jgi:hypothetical protein
MARRPPRASSWPYVFSSKSTLVIMLGKLHGRGGIAVEQVVERAVADVPQPGAVPKVRAIL